MTEQLPQPLSSQPAALLKRKPTTQLRKQKSIFTSKGKDNHNGSFQLSEEEDMSKSECLDKVHDLSLTSFLPKKTPKSYFCHDDAEEEEDDEEEGGKDSSSEEGQIEEGQ